MKKLIENSFLEAFCSAVFRLILYIKLKFREIIIYSAAKAAKIDLYD